MMKTRSAGIELDHGVDDRVDQRRLAGAGAADHQDVPVRLDGGRQGRLLRGGHDPGRDVLFEREDRHGLLADGESRRGDDRRKLAGEARAINRQLAFENRLVPRHFLAVIAGHRLDDRFGAGKGNAANAAHLLAQPFLPQPAVGIEHHLDGPGVGQGVHDERPQITLQLPLRPILEGGNGFFDFCHVSIPVCFGWMSTFDLRDTI
jgi:hypothetical protein